jgi:CRP/FNR family transcriptional regulator, cyclic AMP receptor protein
LEIQDATEGIGLIDGMLVAWPGCNLAYTSDVSRCGSIERGNVAVREASTLKLKNLSTSFRPPEVFKGLPSDFLREIEKRSEVRDFDKGHVFFRAGQNGQGLFLLEKGAVQTFRTSGVKKLIIADLKAPATFGEMGCVGRCLYHCTAQATEPSRVRILSGSRLYELLEQHPIITRRLLDLVSERFVSVLMDLDATSFRQLIPRLAGLLLERADDDLVRNLTHKELAQHLHVYRESATAALGELKKAGIVEIGRKRIRILNRARLERAARE